MNERFQGNGNRCGMCCGYLPPNHTFCRECGKLKSKFEELWIRPSRFEKVKTKLRSLYASKVR